MAYADDYDEEVDNEILRMVLEESMNYTNIHQNPKYTEENEYNYYDLDNDLDNDLHINKFTKTSNIKNYDTIVKSNDDFLRYTLERFNLITNNIPDIKHNIETNKANGDKQDKQYNTSNIAQEDKQDITQQDTQDNKLYDKKNPSSDELRNLRLKYFKQK